MKTEIRTRGVELTPSLKAWLEQRLHFALSRFAPRVRSVRVSLSDENGPRGGVDQACAVTIDAEPAVTVLVRDADAEVHAAASRAIERAAHTLSRALGRLRFA